MCALDTSVQDWQDTQDTWIFVVAPIFGCWYVCVGTKEYGKDSNTARTQQYCNNTAALQAHSSTARHISFYALILLSFLSG
jgi:hypothetical protein